MLPILALAIAMVAGAKPLEPGDHKRTLNSGGIKRAYRSEEHTSELQSH